MYNDSQPIHFSQYHSGNWQTIDSSVIIEMPVSLTVNGEIWLTFMCTPNNLEALAVGFLFNEGIIQQREEIAEVRVCPEGDNVDVWLHHSTEKPKQWKRTSGCSGGVTAIIKQEEKRVFGDDFVLPPEKIADLIIQLFESQKLYRQVGGVHTSALTDGLKFYVITEDIGRHNTLDKIAGRFLLDGIAIHPKMLITTGRVSSEMMQKAAHLGASFVISRTSPSSLSIEMAEEWGITLIGYTRRDRFNVYTHPERVQMK